MKTSCSRTWSVGLFALAAFVMSVAQPRGWLMIDRGSLCVTEGALESSSSERMRVSVPKMRAYVIVPTAQSAELRFKYLGPTSKDVPLGSGILRRQFGLKLRAQDACNLLYAIWRIEPESKLVVSVKRNPGQHTSAECGNRGYENVKPGRSFPAPRLEVGQSHTLRAEMEGNEMRVLVDNGLVWEGTVGSDAAALDGPVGIRSDNAQVEFDLMARRPNSGAPGRACKAAGDSD